MNASSTIAALTSPAVREALATMGNDARHWARGARCGRISLPGGLVLTTPEALRREQEAGFHLGVEAGKAISGGAPDWDRAVGRARHLRVV